MWWLQTSSNYFFIVCQACSLLLIYRQVSKYCTLFLYTKFKKHLKFVYFTKFRFRTNKDKRFFLLLQIILPKIVLIFQSITHIDFEPKTEKNHFSFQSHTYDLNRSVFSFITLSLFLYNAFVPKHYLTILGLFQFSVVYK